MSQGEIIMWMGVYVVLGTMTLRNEISHRKAMKKHKEFNA